jgi:hypothetical protein
MTQNTAAKQSNGQATDKTAIRPFNVNVPESELTELRRRVEATKWPERETDLVSFNFHVPISGSSAAHNDTALIISTARISKLVFFMSSLLWRAIIHAPAAPLFFCQICGAISKPLESMFFLTIPGPSRRS